MYNEIRILKSLSHKNIIAFYDQFENFEKHFMILEYCDGGDLLELMQQKTLSE